MKIKAFIDDISELSAWGRWVRSKRIKGDLEKHRVALQQHMYNFVVRILFLCYMSTLSRTRLANKHSGQHGHHKRDRSAHKAARATGCRPKGEIEKS